MADKRRWLCAMLHVSVNLLLGSLTTGALLFERRNFANPREEYLAAGKLHQLGLLAAVVFVTLLLFEQVTRRACVLSQKESHCAAILKYVTTLLFLAWMAGVAVGITSDIGPEDARMHRATLYFFPAIYAAYLAWMVSVFVGRRRGG